jgi:ketosteroid isomerase-like protein
MTRAFLVVLLLSSSLLCTAQTKRKTAPHPVKAQSAEQKQQFQDDQAAIAKLHSADIQASIALDAPALEELWTDDIVTIAPGEAPVVGKAQNVAKLEKSIEQMKSLEILAYDEQWQEIRIEGDWAYEWGLITGRTRPFSGDTKETSYRINSMRILKREPDGSWRIARSVWNDATAPPANVPTPKTEEKPKDKLKD